MNTNEVMAIIENAVVVAENEGLGPSVEIYDVVTHDLGFDMTDAFITISGQRFSIAVAKEE